MDAQVDALATAGSVVGLAFGPFVVLLGEDVFDQIWRQISSGTR